MPAVTGPPQLLTLHKTSITGSGSGLGPKKIKISRLKSVGGGVCVCVCLYVHVTHWTNRYWGASVLQSDGESQTGRGECISTLVNVALSEPRLRQKGLRLWAVC